MLAKFCAEKFHDARIKRNMTQEELAEKAGISSRYLRALESGQKNNPSASLLCRLALALGVPMDALMDVSGEETVS